MHCYQSVPETQTWDSFNIARIVTWAEAAEYIPVRFEMCALSTKKIQCNVLFENVLQHYSSNARNTCSLKSRSTDYINP